MKTYCEILYPGSFFLEESVIEVATRNPAEIAADVEALGPEYRILRANMNNDGWGVMVKTRRGNFQPFGKDCELIA